jgi:hypothetical protein
MGTHKRLFIMEKRSIYLKVDSRNRVTLTKLSKRVTQLYRARSENGTLILEPVQETPVKKVRTLSPKKTKSQKAHFKTMKLKTKGHKFNREDANAR